MQQTQFTLTSPAARALPKPHVTSMQRSHLDHDLSCRQHFDRINLSPVQVYTIYSILSLVFVILIIVTAFITIALTYFQLAVEDHGWWWRSFLCGGSTGAREILLPTIAPVSRKHHFAQSTHVRAWPHATRSDPVTAVGDSLKPDNRGAQRGNSAACCPSCSLVAQPPWWHVFARPSLCTEHSERARLLSRDAATP